MPYKDPEQRRNYDADYKRLRRAGSPTLSNPLVPPAERIATARDVLDLLSEQMHLVRSAENADPMDRARTVGFLCGICLKAIESGDQAARIEALERALKLRVTEQREQERASKRSNGHG